MGFIAQYEDNWADEMDVFGLRYFNSMTEYVEEFCWHIVFDCFGIEMEELFNFLNIPYLESYDYSTNFEKILVEHFTKHPNELEECYFQEIDASERDWWIECFDKGNTNSIYINFIYAALLIKMEENKDNEDYDLWSEEFSICVGTNEDIPIYLGDYLPYIYPEIFAEGEIADKIVGNDLPYCKGNFYM